MDQELQQMTTVDDPAREEEKVDPALRFSVVVPCYNEEGAIRETITELRRHLGAVDTYELIIVNDGSSDNSANVLAEAVAEDPSLRVVHHRVNRGYGAALKTGIRAARSEFVVITDADGTYPNHRIPELVDLAWQGADMVVGSRTGAGVVYSKIRKIPKIFLRRYCQWLAGEPVPDMNSGLRIMRKTALRRFIPILPNGFSFTTTITLAMLTNNLDVRWVEIDYAARVGSSKIRPIRDTLNFFNLIVRTGMYFAPLRVFMPIAAFFFFGFLISLGYDLWIRNITQSTLLLFFFTLNTAMFALLADMIDKRSEV